MANKTPPALAALFNKILVNFNQSQSQPQMADIAMGGQSAPVSGRKRKERDYADPFRPNFVYSDGPMAAPMARRNVNQGPNRRGVRAGLNGSWHPLARVKNAIRDFLPTKYWSTYTVKYNFGPGRPSGQKQATKIKWRKVLGDVFSVNKMGRLRYTKGNFKTYENRKRWKQAVGRRANGWRY